MSPGARKLLDLPRGCCVWPLGDPALDSFRWCGKPALWGKPYCAAHAARAYTSESASLVDDATTEDDRSEVGAITEERSAIGADAERSGGRTYRVELARGRGLGDKRQWKVVPAGAQKPLQRSPGVGEGLGLHG
jgi:hypothetical protein